MQDHGYNDPVVKHAWNVHCQHGMVVCVLLTELLELVNLLTDSHMVHV